MLIVALSLPLRNDTSMSDNDTDSTTDTVATSVDSVDSDTAATPIEAVEIARRAESAELRLRVIQEQLDNLQAHVVEMRAILNHIMPLEDEEEKD